MEQVPTPVTRPQEKGSLLSSSLRHELWCCIADRLNRGEPLVTAGDYQQAMEEDYWNLTDVPLSKWVQSV